VGKTVLPDRPSAPVPRDRLDSWKEIAAYLNCSERTVRRWQEEGLPVHRHVHKSKAGIYAYKAEIDAWWRNGHEQFKEMGESTDQPLTGALARQGPARSLAGWRLTGMAVTAMAVIAGAGLLASWTSLGPHPKVEAVTQLTNDAQPKEGRLATDGTRVYFNEGQSGSWRIAQVSVNGGETARVDTRFSNLQIAGMAPDNSTLLVLVGSFTDPYDAWLLPLPAGEPRRLLAVKAQDAGFFPDGRIVFTQGAQLYVAEKDGSTAHKLLASLAAAWSPGVSPDGKRIVFDSGSLQEASVADRSPHDLLNAESNLLSPCCGQWSPDGRYILFQAEQEGRSDLWTLPSNRGLLRASQRPIHLTQGPLSYTNAIPSRDGKRIFAIGSRRRGELVRYDKKSRAFVSYLSGISATDATFSADGAWVAYRGYPDHTLWRSRSDGSERLQLTYPPTTGIYPAISPDGTMVTFGTSDAVYVISMNGGTPRKISDHSIAATWSPDGKRMLLTSTIPGNREQEKNTVELKSADLLQTELRIVDLSNQDVSVVPESRGKVGGFWVTQDTLVAANRDSTKFLLFDLKAQKWTELASGTFVNWMLSADHNYLYCTTGGEEPAALRIRLANGAVEHIAKLKSFRRVVDAITGTQVGVTPDGSLLLTRDIGWQEIYALSVKWP
jgi:Tol biopolymer transport system component